VNPPSGQATILQKYGWEATLVGIIGVAIATPGIVTHLMPRRVSQIEAPAAVLKLGSPQSYPSRVAGTTLPSGKDASQTKNHTSLPAQRSSRQSDPHEIVIGPSSIRGRFTLLAVDRKRGVSASDELTLRLRVVSLAMADLVTPFQSAMLDVRVDGQEPIRPQHEFSHPVPAKDHWDEDVVFTIPSSVNLAHAALRIEYYPETKEIRLDLPPLINTH
jgi:hypothetical protein